MTRRVLELLIWTGLWLVESLLARRFQPTALMSVMAVGVLTLAAACLLIVARSSPAVARPGLQRVLPILAACGLGFAAATVIRGLYLWFYPDVRPFGFAFNVVADTAWVSLHAIVVGSLLRRTKRR